MIRVFFVIAFWLNVSCPLLRCQVFFDNYYNVGFNSLSSENIITRDDSGYVCVNFVADSATGRTDANLIWLDKNGGHVKNKSLNYFNQNQGGFIFGRNYFNRFTKSSYLLQGASYPGQVQAPLFLKFDSFTLDTIKTVAFQDNNYNYAVNNFIKVHENKFLLIGNRWNSSNSNSTVIFHIDSNLNIIQLLSVNTPTNYTNLNAIYSKSIGKIILGGILTLPGIQKNALIQVDTLGIISHSIVSTDAKFDGAGQFEYSDFDTSFITYGAKGITPYGGFYLRKLCITKYDRNLNMKWQKVYGQESLNNGLNSMIVESDGSIVASGAYSKQTTLPFINEDLNGVIIKVDKNGNFNWMREFNHHPPGNLAEIFRGIDRTKENGYVACGSITYLPKGVAWIVKTDSVGCVLPGCPSSTVQVDSVIITPPNPVSVGSRIENFQLRIFPNPARELLRVEPVWESTATYNLQILDLLGRTYYQEVITNAVSVDVRAFPAGLYILKVCDETDRAVSLSKFLKE